MGQCYALMEGTNLDAPPGEAAGKPRELTVGNRNLLVPVEYCNGHGVIAVIKIGPDGVEQPAEFRLCSEHSRTFVATLGDLAAEHCVPDKMNVGGLNEEEFKGCNATFAAVQDLTDRFGEFSARARRASVLCDNGTPPRALQMLICIAALMLTAGVNRFLANIKNAADFDERIAQLGAKLSAYERRRAKAAAFEAAAQGASALAEAGAIGGGGGGHSVQALRTLAEHITPATSVTVGAVNESLRQVQGGTSIRPGTTPKGLQSLLVALKIKAHSTSGIGKRALLAAQILFLLIDPTLFQKFLLMAIPMANAEFAGMLCKMTGHAVVSVFMLLDVQALLNALAALGWLHMEFFNLAQQLRADLRRVENSAFDKCIDVLRTHVVVVHIRDSFNAFDQAAGEDTTFTPFARWSPEAQLGISGFESEFNRLAVDMRSVASKRAATAAAGAAGGQHPRQQQGWGNNGLGQAPPAWGAGAPGGGAGFRLPAAAGGRAWGQLACSGRGRTRALRASSGWGRARGPRAGSGRDRLHQLPAGGLLSRRRLPLHALALGWTSVKSFVPLPRRSGVFTPAFA
mmetsp:Transcript_54709/g.102436  ORF Transcript_54709/g.102436 Transcript_54709/m.102436 type:complete len:571 (+) Transcript_54709:87-1799(+)